MKNILAIFCILTLSCGFSQKDKVYKVSDLATANSDSVFIIDISRIGLTVIPQEIYEFKNLRELNLGKNKLTEIPNLEAFPNLKILNVEKNKLEYFPISICQLKNLEKLILNRNAIATIPSCIQYCTQLQYLDLWGTAVTSLPNEMMQLKQLKEIDFSDVQINVKAQQQLKGMFQNVKLILDPPCNCAAH